MSEQDGINEKYRTKNNRVSNTNDHISNTDNVSVMYVNNEKLATEDMVKRELKTVLSEVRATMASLFPRESVIACTTGCIRDCTYSNSDDDNTFHLVVPLDTLLAVLDGYSFQSTQLTNDGIRILVKNGMLVVNDGLFVTRDGGEKEFDCEVYNGIYTITQNTHDTTHDTVIMRRSPDCNGITSSTLIPHRLHGAFVFVEDGTVNKGRGFVGVLPDGQDINLNRSPYRWLYFTSFTGDSLKTDQPNTWTATQQFCGGC